MSRLILSNAINYRVRERAIALQTSLGNDIDNYQIGELSQYEINSFAAYSQNNWAACIFKGQPTPMYNCHGFTFASRRTNIDNSQEIGKILRDDNYVAVSPNSVMIGDVILYVDGSGSGDIVHTGLVVGVDFVGELPFVRVLSKWGKFKEVVHAVRDCPYGQCIIEFWRNNHGYVPTK